MEADDQLRKLIDKSRLPEELNAILDCWVSVPPKLSHAQTVSVKRPETIITSRLQVVRYIFAVISGNESELFIWQNNSGRFRVARAIGLLDLNAGPFRTSLEKYAKLGTLFREMYDFATCNDRLFASRGRTFGAFKVVLQATLNEIISQTVDILEQRYRFKLIRKNSATDDDDESENISLIGFEHDEEHKNIFLTIRHLHATYLQAIKVQSFEWPRLYAHQTLLAIYERLSISHQHLQNVFFTLLNQCLGPFFNSLEYLLTSFTTISELTAATSSEYFFTSRFESDDDLYMSSYSHSELVRFWDDFLHLDEQVHNEATIPFFSTAQTGCRRGGGGERLKVLIEAIKASFALRMNGLSIEPSVKEMLTPGAIAVDFRRFLRDVILRYAHKDECESINLETPYETTQVPLNVPEGMFTNCPSLSHPRFQSFKQTRFKGYQLPLLVMVDLDSAIGEAFTATFERISRPIMSTFLEEFRCRHLRLLRYYTDFFLFQSPEHLIHYVCYLFPTIKGAVEGKGAKVGDFTSKLMNIHRNNRSIDCLSPGMTFFRPTVLQAEKTVIESSDAPHTAHLRLLSCLFFLPSFNNTATSSSNFQTSNRDEDGSRPFYDFWPLQQLFNGSVTSLFNFFLQFMLKLRYSQYQLVEKFFVDSKGDGLRRHFLLNHLVTIGFSLECRLKELVMSVEKELEEAASFDAYLATHQSFLEKISLLREFGEREEGLIATTIASTAKFCNASLVNGSCNGSLSGEEDSGSSLGSFVSKPGLKRQPSLYQMIEENLGGVEMNFDFDSIHSL